MTRQFLFGSRGLFVARAAGLAIVLGVVGGVGGARHLASAAAAQAAPAPTAAEADAAMVAKLEAIRAGAKLPALGGAIVTSKGLEGAWVTGERAAGSGIAVAPGDRWHLGSCLKSMTATLIALLVERGDLDWDATLPELLPELASTIHPGYEDVTLVELLCHRAGVPSDLGRAGLWAKCWQREGTPAEQRAVLAKAVLEWGPVHPPRTKYLYANAGFALAGHIAEVRTGKPYEQLIQELLFEPLGIQTAGFGPPGTPKTTGEDGKPRIDEPRGHDGAGAPVEPGPAADNPPAIAPGGTCHMSLADWGRYLSLHLRGAKGDVKVGDITLHADTFKKLHTAFDGPGESYGFGWILAERPWAGGDGTVWTHNGSNTLWFCVCWLAPNSDFAVLATTNMMGTTGPPAADRVASTLIQEHLERVKRAESSTPAK